MSGARRRSPIGTSPFPADALDALLPEPEPDSDAAPGERDADDKGDDGRQDGRGGTTARPVGRRRRREQTDAGGSSSAASTRARRRPAAPPPAREQPAGDQPVSVVAPPPRPVGPTKVPISGQIQPSVLEEARNAVAFLPTKGEVGFTLNALLENALRAELARLRRRYNAGEPFPQRGSALPVGRRIAT